MDRHRQGLRADVESTVRALVGAVVAYLVEDPSIAVTEVYLLAYTDAELTACRATTPTLSGRSS